MDAGRVSLLLLVLPAAALLAAPARGAALPGDELGLLSTQGGLDPMTHQGSDFWIGFMRNIGIGGGFPPSSISLSVTTNEPNPVGFTVEMPNGDNDTATASYGSTMVVSLPLDLLVATTSNAELEKGIHVTTNNPNEKITVFGLNFEDASTDAFLALPCRTYESVTRYEYFIFSSAAITSLLQSQFLIVPCQDNTQIWITPTVTISFPINFDVISEPNLGMFPAGEVGSLWGQAGQTILLTSSEDLTGTIVMSDKPLSVFSGHECGFVPQSLTACDHLVEQVPPHITWGTTFFTAPLALRQSGEMYRVGSIYNGTEVRVTCTQQETGAVRTFGPLTINRGQYFEFTTRGNPVVGSPPAPTIPRDDYRPEFCCIQTSEIAVVMGYSLGHSVDEVGGPGGAQGDPFMILIPPVTQYLNSYTVPQLLNLDQLFSASLYISYVIPVEFFSGSLLDQHRVLIDEELFCPNSGYFPISCNGSETVCAYGAYSEITGTQDHTILYNDIINSSIQVSVYDFSREISYGYPAGMELEAIGLPRISCCQENTVVLESIGTFKLCIRRTGNMQLSTRAMYETFPLSATGGVDYNIVAHAAQPTLRFGMSDTEPRDNAVQFTIMDDNRVEGNEQIEILLTPLRDAFIYPISRCTITIVDNDTPPGCFFDPTFYTVNEANGFIEITVWNNEPNNTAFQNGACCLTTKLLSNEDNASADDFNGTSECRPVIFQEGAFTTVETITIVNDDVIESDESFTVCLSSSGVLADLVIPENASNAFIVIQDDDSFFQCHTEVACAGSPFSGTTLSECCLENGFSYSINGRCYNCTVYGWLETEVAEVESSVAYTLSVGTLKGNMEEQQTFAVQHVGGTADMGPLGDFIFAPSLIFIEAQEISLVNITLFVDRIALEPNETIQLRLVPVVCSSGVFLDEDINVEIIDGDVVSVSFAEATFSAIESQGLLQLRVEKTGFVATNFTVAVETLTLSEALPDGNGGFLNTATSGSDFVSQTILREFAADEDAQSLVCPVQDLFVTILDDVINEASEEYFIAQLVVISVEHGVDIHSVRIEQSLTNCSILDDDDISIVFNSTRYNGTEGFGGVVVTTLTKMSVTSDQTFLLEIMPNTSLSQDLNLTAVGVIEFPPHEQTMEIRIPIIDDNETEGIEIHQARVISSADGPQLRDLSVMQQTIIVLGDDEYLRCRRSVVPVRLSGGSSDAEGRVEFCFRNNWAPLCSPTLTAQSAEDICQQLNFTNGYLRFDGNGAAITVQRYVAICDDCPEQEMNLTGVGQCSRFGRVSCRECSEGSVQLTNVSSDQVFQKLEVCVQGRWAQVCADYWNRRDGNVVCRQINSTQQAGYTVLRPSIIVDDGPFINRVCTGEERRLLDCEERMVSNCTSGTVGIACGPLSESKRQCNERDIRLADGSTDQDGRVEICHDGIWGTVCGQDWDDSDATVVCQQLGFLKGIVSSDHLPGSGPIFLSEVNCRGAENNILQCGNSGIGVHDCIGHSQDAGVLCQECNDLNVTVDEDGGVRYCMDGEWFAICGSRSWTDDEATVVCSSATNFSIGSADTLSNGTLPILPTAFICNGDEASLNDCQVIPAFDTSNCTENAAVSCRNQVAIGGLSSSATAGITVAVVIFLALVVLCFVLIIWMAFRTRKYKNQRPIRFTLRTVDPNSLKQKNPYLKYYEGLPDDLLISQEYLRLLDIIGQGEFGVVYKAHLVSPPSTVLRRMSDYRTVTRQSKPALQVAVKTLHSFFSEKDVAALMDEFLRMKDFDHHNVLTILGVCVDAGAAPYIVMPYMSNGSLLQFVRDNRDTFIITDAQDVNLTFMTTKMINICLQICKGMEYLASNNVIHRDLAARNCMISGDWVVKVADFGLSATAYANTYTKLKKDADTKLPIKWMAPEAFDLDKFSEKSDVWSFGVTCWEVYSGGSTPYPGMNDPKTLVDFIRSGGRLDKPTSISCSDEMYELLLSCWEEDMQTRPTFRQLVEGIETILGMVSGYMQLTPAPLQQLRASGDKCEKAEESGEVDKSSRASSPSSEAGSIKSGFYAEDSRSDHHDNNSDIHESAL